MDKTVSVVIPIYHYEKFTAEALESVVNQSVKPHEIIIVNDGCIDNSMEIVNDFVKKYPEHNWIIVDKKNGGLASARNAGLKVATGKYFMSFDADDIMKPDCIKEHLAVAGEDTIATCGLMAFGDTNYTAIPETATLEILLQRNCIYSNSLVPVKLLREVGGFDESEIMKWGLEDWECWIRMAERGVKFATSFYIGLLWRRHGGNMSETLCNPHWKELTDYFKEKHKHLYKRFDLI
jgi:glycosyltransferase involved in cell wall biosynthesis